MHCNDLSLHGGEGSVQMLLLLTVAFWVRRLQFTSNAHAEFYASDIKMIPTWLNVNCFLH